MSTEHPTTNSPNWTFFAALHGTFFAAVIVLGITRGRDLRQPAELPPLRDVPITVRPLYDYDVVVTDDQLTDVLTKLVPRFPEDNVRINHVDHALRFWGDEAEFADPTIMDGQAMRQLLMDHRRFAEVYGSAVRPLLIDVPTGIRVRVQEGIGSSSHVDHTIASLAEVGTPLDFPVRTPTRETTFGDVVRQSLRDFSVNQQEYEWSALTYTLMMSPARSWISTEGQTIDFDRLARRIMRQAMPQGVCFGNHRLYTLAIMLRVDEEHPQHEMLSPPVREEILQYLSGMTARLVQHQHWDGFWNANWPHAAPPERKPSDTEGDRLMDRILATGHAMEWWTMAPEELHPPRDTLSRAGQWLCRTILDLDEEQTLEYYTYLSHAGRALAIWRGKEPAEVALGL